MPATQQSDNTDDIQNEDEVMDMMEENNEEIEGFPLKFRSYVPRDERLKKYVMEKSGLVGANIVAEIDEKLNAAIKLNKERDILNLAPKKANWDLKRDIESKLEMLDLRTERAIVDLVLAEKNKP